MELANRLAGQVVELQQDLKAALAREARSSPQFSDWVAHAIAGRRLALARVEGCASARCVCRPEHDGAHQAPDCACHTNAHDMLEVAKINNRFAAAVASAFGSDA
jgi:ribosomal protein L22